MWMRYVLSRWKYSFNRKANISFLYLSVFIFHLHLRAFYTQMNRLLKISFFFFCTIFKAYFSFHYYKMLSVFPTLYNNIRKPARHGNNSCTSPLKRTHTHTTTTTSFFSISVSYPFLNRPFWQQNCALTLNTFASLIAKSKKQLRFSEMKGSHNVLLSLYSDVICLCTLSMFHIFKISGVIYPA